MIRNLADQVSVSLLPAHHLAVVTQDLETNIYPDYPFPVEGWEETAGNFKYWLLAHPSQSQYSMGAISACTGVL